MANTHPGNLGDVLKHLLLCEALESQPFRYIDSHAGAYSYDLADAPDPGTGGVWDFATMAAADPVLADSAYSRHAVPRAGSRQSPGTYLGSVALADELLESSTTMVVGETNPATITALEQAFAASARNVLILGHPLEGQDVAAQMAGGPDLVLIDPFDVHEQSLMGRSSVDAFCEAAKKGAATYLWYPLTAPDEEASWVRDTLAPAGIQPFQLEIRYPQKAAGLWGCGLVAAQIPPKAYLRSVDLWASLTRGLLATGVEYNFVTSG